MITTIIFICLLFGIFGKLLAFAIKATWSLTKILFTIVFFPLILVGLVMAGLMYVAMPVLIIAGIIVLFVTVIAK